jgi:predicted ABC-type ATPase
LHHDEQEPVNPESVAIEAGRLMLTRIEKLLKRDESFSIETTLATKSYINLVRRAQAQTTYNKIAEYVK